MFIYIVCQLCRMCAICNSTFCYFSIPLSFCPLSPSLSLKWVTLFHMGILKQWQSCSGHACLDVCIGFCSSSPSTSSTNSYIIGCLALLLCCLCTSQLRKRPLKNQHWSCARTQHNRYCLRLQVRMYFKREKNTGVEAILPWFHKFQKKD